MRFELSFERSAPVGPIHRLSDTGLLHEGAISLSVNGEPRQQGNLNQMIWKVPEMISYLSAYFELAAGDVIQTGTPSGVGPVVKGDVMKISADGLGSLTIPVV